jgi:pantoate kinase
MKKAKAFTPCHITGIFEIFDKSADALHVGSRGAGVSLSEGVETTATVRKSLNNFLQVKINGSVSNSAKVSQHVVNTFRGYLKEKENLEIIVEHCTKVPIGAGLGTSGAATLSLALALNEVFDLGMSKLEVAQLAHKVEVECKTGLGTVIAETFGGLEIRVKAGAPGIGEIQLVTVPEDVVVACIVFAPLSTKRFLTNEETRRRINELGGKLVDKLVEKPNFINLMKLSRQFAEHVGLITDKVRSVLKEADEANFICSMPMFGESVFTLIERERTERLLEIFRRYDAEKIVVSEIDREGARLLQ